jgi:hypothetical protein
MDAIEYAARREAAEQDLDRRVESWRQFHIMPPVAKTVGHMAWLLTTAAVIGFATGGPVGALVWPVLVTLPAISFAGHASQ